MPLMKNITTRKSGLSLADIVALCLVMASFAGFITVARYWAHPMEAQKPFEITYASLPTATLLSISRILLAYILSLVSSIVLGYWAAHSKAAEVIIIPIVDILQSVPALGFLPGFALTLTMLFPNSHVGLEITCVLLIYTSMAWNMILGFYSSIKAIPKEYYDIIQSYGYGRLGTLLRLELPHGIYVLAWNSMLSVAGGWFFLTICESFTLGDRSYKLIGLGSYMTVATEMGNIHAMITGVLIMLCTLIFIDRLIWKPVLRWAERFHQTDLDDNEELQQEATMVRFFSGSKLIARAMARFRKKYGKRFLIVYPSEKQQARVVGYSKFALVAFSIFFLILCAFGVYEMIHSIISLPITDWIIILKNTLWTSFRVLMVIILCMITMVPLGLWFGSHPNILKKMQAVVQIIAAFPFPMIFPIFIQWMLWLSIPISFGSIFLMMVGAQWYTLFNVLAGAASIPKALIDIAKISGLKGIRLLTRVYIPATFPHLITGLLTAAGGAWNASIVAELVMFRGQEYVAPGLGAYIAKSATTEHYPQLIAAVCTMVVFIVFVNRFIWAKLYELVESKYRLMAQ